MRCAACQTDNPKDAKFCYRCGAPLGRMCARCGTDTLGLASYCRSCGAPLTNDRPGPVEGHSEPRRSAHRRTWVVLVAAGVIIVGLAAGLAVSLATGGSPTLSQSPNGTNGQPTISLNNRAVAKIVKWGQPMRWRNDSESLVLSVTVSSPQEVRDSNVPSSEKLLSCAVTFKNEGNLKRMTSAQFFLQDNEGLTYKAGASRGSSLPDLPLTIIDPGQAVDGYVFFVIPREKEPLAVIQDINPLGGGPLSAWTQ